MCYLKPSDLLSQIKAPVSYLLLNFIWHLMKHQNSSATAFSPLRSAKPDPFHHSPPSSFSSNRPTKLLGNVVRFPGITPLTSVNRDVSQFFKRKTIDYYRIISPPPKKKIIKVTSNLCLKDKLLMHPDEFFDTLFSGHLIYGVPTLPNDIKGQ